MRCQAQFRIGNSHFAWVDRELPARAIESPGSGTCVRHVEQVRQIRVRLACPCHETVRSAIPCAGYDFPIIFCRSSVSAPTRLTSNVHSLSGSKLQSSRSSASSSSAEDFPLRARPLAICNSSGEYVSSPSSSSQYSEPYCASVPLKRPAKVGPSSGPVSRPCQWKWPPITCGSASSPRRRLMKSSQGVRSSVSTDRSSEVSTC